MPKRKRSSSRSLTVYRRRRTTNFRKRVARRRYTRSKVGYRPRYTFHRWVTALQGMNVTNCTYDTGTSVLTATAANATASMSLLFRLDDVPNPAEFSGLFDSYMITGVMLQIKMINNPSSNSVTNGSATSQTNNWWPTVWYVPDHDDHNNMTLPQIKEFERVRHKVLRPNSHVNIMLRPTTLNQVFRSTLTTGYAENRKRQWLDLAQTDIPHYGFKCVIDFEGLSPTSTFTFKINAKYYFACKNVR